MSANTFGQLFRVTTFGESHGGAVGCVIDGCPGNIVIDMQNIQSELARRATGQSKITSQRKEEDAVEVLSGVFEGKTLGTPICMMVKNKNARSEDYIYLKDKYRPGHADLTYEQKYGIRAWAGGGRASARETTARVIAGAIAKQILRELLDVEILGYVSQVGSIKSQIKPKDITFNQVESNIVRCPDTKKAQEMIALIEKVLSTGDSIGGVVTCIARKVPSGLGEPVFDKLTADLAKACMSIPATKGVEFGSGFGGCKMKGDEHNDPYIADKDGNIRTQTNNAGGIQGGISSGEDILLNVAFKPVSTISIIQNSVNNKGENIKLENKKGRHDPCVVPRAVPVVESMVALALLDHYLRQKAQNL